MSARKIFIHCDGGFANRFNVLIGGLFLAETLTLTPIILWNSNNWCGAKFFDIFYPTLQTLEFDSKTFFKLNSVKIISHENQFNQELDYELPSNFNSINEILNYVGNESDIFYYNNIIASWVSEDFFRSLNSMLTIKSEILDAAHELIKKYKLNEYYGLHFRKTDFIGIESVDDNYYRNYIQSNPNFLFFVCSDDQKTEMDFKQHPNVFTYEKTNYVEKYSSGEWDSWIVDENGNQFPFNVKRSSESVKEAVVDLLILSYSNIINTSSSTFLKTAALFKKYNLFR
jgi:hypothetical protein